MNPTRPDITSGTGEASQNGAVTAVEKEHGALRRRAPWVANAERLTVWTVKHMVNRRDRHGRYYRDQDGKTCSCMSGELTDNMILKHFQARETDGIIGPLTGAYEELEGTGHGCSTSKFTRIEVDNHGDSPEPDANFRASHFW